MTAAAATSGKARGRPSLAWVGFLVGLALCSLATSGLEEAQRVVLVIYAAALLGWCLGLAEDWITSAIAVAALWAAGAARSSEIAAAAAHDLVWLLVAAYLIAFVLGRAGLLETLGARVLRRPATLSTLAYRLTALVAATAFVVPATSARAAMLLPLHRALAARLADAHAERALALLFPSVVLLSAGGVLTGAAAHVVALEVIEASGGARLGYGDWLAHALPVALASSFAATWLILRLFLSAPARERMLSPSLEHPDPLAPAQVAMLVVLVMAVGLWMTNEWHGAGLATVGLLAALALMLVGFRPAPPSGAELARAVDCRLLALLVSTIVLAKALVTSGAAHALADALMRALPGEIIAYPHAMLGLIAAVSMLAHLVIPSRSARAAVLIPALALPLGNAGTDVATLALVIALATGFCQLTHYGAKPLLIFAGGVSTGSFRRDLLRLGLPLFLVSWVLLVATALLVWPAL